VKLNDRVLMGKVPVLMIPDILAGPDVLRPLAEALPMPVFGLTWPSMDVVGGFTDLAGVAAWFIVALGKSGIQGPFLILGHGIGATLAIELAMQYGEMAAAVVLLDPRTLPPYVPPDFNTLDDRLITHEERAYAAWQMRLITNHRMIRDPVGSAQLAQFCTSVRRRYGSMNGLQEVFHEMDADHSGEIDYDEFLTICDEVKFPGNPVTLFKYLDADGSKTLSFDELDARVMEALIWEERPAAPLSCPLHALSVDDGANNRETGGTAGFMSNAFQDAGTVHARLLTVVQRTKLLERTLEAGNHFTIIADRSQREDLAVELTEVYCNVRSKLKNIVDDVQDMRRRQMAMFKGTMERLEARQPKPKKKSDRTYKKEYVYKEMFSKSHPEFEANSKGANSKDTGDPLPANPRTAAQL